jgi:hypothetical protein
MIQATLNSNFNIKFYIIQFYTTKQLLTWSLDWK